MELRLPGGAFLFMGRQAGARHHRRSEQDARLEHAYRVPGRGKESFYLEQLPHLKPIQEVLEIIEAEHGRIPFAVVSGSRRESVVGSLSVLHLLDKFDVLVSAEDYKNAKPAPDPFLIAAERLGVAAKDCLVFEDTALGIQSATAAGMASVMVPFIMHRN
jgi:HAD superfamily hydrolase (TIGR01509 family)